MEEDCLGTNRRPPLTLDGRDVGHDFDFAACMYVYEGWVSDDSNHNGRPDVKTSWESGVRQHWSRMMVKNFFSFYSFADPFAGAHRQARTPFLFWFWPASTL